MADNEFETKKQVTSGLKGPLGQSLSKGVSESTESEATSDKRSSRRRVTWKTLEDLGKRPLKDSIKSTDIILN
jgi:hypothetical protein